LHTKCMTLKLDKDHLEEDTGAINGCKVYT